MADGSENGEASPPKREPKCPICGRATHAATRPFCSPRCANVDLSRWLNNGYAIVTHADAEEDEMFSADSTLGLPKAANEDGAGNEDGQ
jgi:uncharacterized protein